MTTLEHDFLPGNLVRARGREWVVQSDTHQGDGGSLLRLRQARGGTQQGRTGGGGCCVEGDPGRRGCCAAA